ncbi:MAG: hypothetical protein QW420_04920 [Candidatus Caldarchaeum sp.]
MQTETLLLAVPALSTGVIMPLAIFTGHPLLVAGAVAAPVAAYAGSAAGKALSGRFEGYAVKVTRSGMQRMSSYEAAEKIASVFGASIASMLAVAGIIIASLMLGVFDIMLLLGLAPAAAPILVTVMTYSNKISERRSKLSIEYPFFMVFASIVAYVGGTVYMALQHAKKAVDVFNQTSKEAAEVERKAVLAGVGVIKGIESHAETIPQEEFARALSTSTSVWRTGGNMVATLEDLSAEALRYLSDKFERFSSSIAAYVEIFFTVLVLMPLGMSLTVVVGGQTTSNMVLLNIFLIPFLGFMLLMLVRNAAPKIPNRITLDAATLVKAVSVLVASAGAVLVVQMLGLPIPYPLLVAAGIAVAALVTYLSMRHQSGEIDDTEKELKRFLRIVVEERKTGRIMYHALKNASAQSYRRYFNSFIKTFSTRLTMGLGIYYAASTARSWLARVIFWLVDMVDRLGGASPELLEKVITLLTNYSAARESQRSRVRLFLYLTYATPFIVAMMFGMIHPLIAGTAFGGQQLKLPEAPQGGPSFSPNPEAAAQMIDTGFLMMIIATCSMAMTISYAMDSHFFGLHRLAITALLFIPAYYTVPIMSEIVRVTMFPSQV